MYQPEPRPQGDAVDPGRFCQGYSPLDYAYDEMCETGGAPRSHWRYLLDALQAIGCDGLEQRRREAYRLIRENGVTYNVYGDPDGVARPWQLDLIPLLIASEEWGRIERGLVQRAEVLNLLLADLYGKRNVLHKGVLPPELIYAHPGFLRPCDGSLRAGRRPVVFYAADLSRGPDGRVWVIGDRAQAPSGAGYALENRLVLSRAMPSLFRDSHVHRLANFFRATRAALGALAPQQGDEPPRTVVLTPGPRNEAYFEHAYLANYLGYTLVQGNDLTVREDGVFLRSLDGLQRVDIILRRVDDEYCDPLELREESCLGVPGLVQAVRAGQVGVANPLGSGVLDNPALMAYMPRLCRFFLGEELLLHGAQTWWCGSPVDREHVLASLEQLVIKPVRPGRGMRSVFGAELDAEELEGMRQAIRARPWLYVGQAQLPLATAPVFLGDHLEPRHVVLRSFLVSRDDGYVVMPGGLSRVAPRPGDPVVSNQHGGVGKDTWVVASEPERVTSLLVERERGVVSAVPGVGVPSRVADNLYWVGRYAERAEALVRLLRVILLHITEQLAFSYPRGLGCCPPELLRALTVQTGTFPGFMRGGAPARLAAPEPELLSIIADPERVGSLPHTLRALIVAARSVRDRLSTDTWRVVSQIDEELERLTGGRLDHASDALDELDALVTAFVAFSGLVAENMRHGHGWRFLEIGRRLERASASASLLRATVVPVIPESEAVVVLESVLTVTDSLIAYRQRYRAGMRVETLLDMIVQDEDNPRAVAYQLACLQRHVEKLPRKDERAFRSQEERLVLEALTALRLSDVGRLTGSVHHGRREALDLLLGAMMERLPRLSDVISAAYFRLEDQPHQLVGARA